MKRIIPVLLILALLMSTVNAAALTRTGFGKAASEVEYNENDAARMRAFLEIEDELGVKNGQKITRDSDVAYDPEDPETWRHVRWNDEGEIVSIAFWSYNFAQYIDGLGGQPTYPEQLLVGTLDVSGMQSLEVLGIQQNRIDGIIADDCPGLFNLACNDNPELVSVSAKNDPSMGYLGTINCSALVSLDIGGSFVRQLEISKTPALSALDLSDCRDSLELIGASESGITSVDLSGMTRLQQANFDSSSLSSINLEGITSSFILSLENTQVKSLDLSSANGITSLDINYSLISELDLTGCENMLELYCEGTPLAELDTTDSPEMYLFDLMGSTALRSARISAYGNTFGITAENGFFDLAMILYYYSDFGKTVVRGNDDLVMLNAYPAAEGAEFIDWYRDSDGEMISDETSIMLDDDLLEELHTQGLSLTARFAAPAVRGDANGDGTVDTEDALLVLRAALGIDGDSAALLANCDMDGSGVIDTTDALLILRLALGITA